MRIFLDSSILIEYIKGNKTEILDQIIESKSQPCINNIVFSEFLFHYISLISGKSPLTLKATSKIKTILEKKEPIDFLENFQTLEINHHIQLMSYDMMKQYNMLPNDALIFSTCKYYDIQFMASLDKDFVIVCKEEEISLIKNEQDMINLF